MPTPLILTRPVEELPISAELSAFMQLHQLSCLEALLRYPSYELLEMKGFSYHCLVELYRLLKIHNCQRLLKED